MNYKAQFDCLSHTTMSHAVAPLWRVVNECEHPIIVGHCLEEVSPAQAESDRRIGASYLTPTRQNKPEVFCDRLNPKPSLGYASQLQRGEETLLDYVDSEVIYWAFTCEP